MRKGIRKHDETKPTPIRERVWWIAIAPSLWAIHFLACYLSAAIWCEKFSSERGNTTLHGLVALYSLIAIVGILCVAWVSYQTLRRGNHAVPYNFDDPAERTHFLSFTAFLLSVLSAIATIFTILAFVLVGGCD
ncbi:transmembrane prediction [Rhodopirellula sallentina]|nr:transmembrane prediction [Rhodopirellula sallentina]